MSDLIISVAGVRGVVGDSLTPPAILPSLAAFGKIMRGKKVVVGGDGRPSFEPLRKFVIGTLTAAGCDVLDTGDTLITFEPGTGFEELLEVVSASEQELFPVVGEDGNLESVFSINDVRRVVATPEVFSLLVASDLGVSAKSMAFLRPSDDLHSAVRSFTAFKREALPVIDGEPPSPVIGFLSHHQVMEAYDQEIHRLRDED